MSGGDDTALLQEVHMSDGEQTEVSLLVKLLDFRGVNRGEAKELATREPNSNNEITMAEYEETETSRLEMGSDNRRS